MADKGHDRPSVGREAPLARCYVRQKVSVGWSQIRTKRVRISQRIKEPRRRAHSVVWCWCAGVHSRRKRNTNRKKKESPRSEHPWRNTELAQRDPARPVRQRRVAAAVAMPLDAAGRDVNRPKRRRHARGVERAEAEVAAHRRRGRTRRSVADAAGGGDRRGGGYGGGGCGRGRRARRCCCSCRRRPHMIAEDRRLLVEVVVVDVFSRHLTGSFRAHPRAARQHRVRAGRGRRRQGRPE